jgi:uncharacterized protein (DUF1778 family)
MPKSAKRKGHSLLMQLSEADFAVIDRAARRRGCSRSDFVRGAAVRAAEGILMEALPIRMSQAAFNAFMETLAKPAAAVPEMLELLRRTAPWESKDAAN